MNRQQSVNTWFFCSFQYFAHWVDGPMWGMYRYVRSLKKLRFMSQTLFMWSRYHWNHYKTPKKWSFRSSMELFNATFHGIIWYHIGSQVLPQAFDLASNLALKSSVPSSMEHHCESIVSIVPVLIAMNNAGSSMRAFCNLVGRPNPNHQEVYKLFSTVVCQSNLPPRHALQPACLWKLPRNLMHTRANSSHQSFNWWQLQRQKDE